MQLEKQTTEVYSTVGFPVEAHGENRGIHLDLKALSCSSAMWLKMSLFDLCSSPLVLLLCLPISRNMHMLMDTKYDFLKLSNWHSV